MPRPDCRSQWDWLEEQRHLVCGDGTSQHGADRRPSSLPTLALQLLPKPHCLGTRLGWGPWGALGLARHLHTPREALGKDFQWTLHFCVTQLGASVESSLPALALIIGWRGGHCQISLAVQALALRSWATYLPSLSPRPLREEEGANKPHLPRP